MSTVADTAHGATRVSGALASVPSAASGAAGGFNPTAFLLLAGSGLTLWVLLTGKMDRVVAAASGKAPAQGWSTHQGVAGSSAPALPNPNLGTYLNGTAPSGYHPNPSLFGLKNVQSYGSGLTVPGIAGVDSSGLTAVKGFPDVAVGDYDYALGTGVSQPVQAPGPKGVSYTVEHVDPPGVFGWNGAVVLKASNDGLIEYMHLLNVNVKQGDEVAGGTHVGDSGGPLAPQYGNGQIWPQNAHLSVIVDSAGAGYLYELEKMLGSVFA